MISMQLSKHGCALPQGSLHGIQMLVQKGTGLSYILCLVCHLPVEAMGNLWHGYVCLWNFITLYRSGLPQGFVFISVKCPMANHCSVCVLPHLFIEWQNSLSRVKECSNW